MTTAAIMAKAGKRVLMLEQHDQIGGSCHSFHEQGFEFDTGVHYIGEMRNNTALRFLYDQLTEGGLEWKNVSDKYDTVVLIDNPDPKGGKKEVLAAVAAGKALPSRQYSMRSGQQETLDELMRDFPTEHKAIKKYFKLLAETRKAMIGFVSIKMMPKWAALFLVRTGLINFYTDYFKLSRKTLEEVLNELTDNKTLKAVLAYNFGDYGTMPKDVPFVMHAVLVNHFLKGVSYPIGGSSQFAYNMVPVIERTGGKALVRADVECIVCEGGRAVGVKMKKTGQILRAPQIISGAGLFNTATLLPKEISDKHYKGMASHARNGVGGLSVYVGMKGSNKELGLEGKHFWCFWTPEGNEDLDGVSRGYVNKDASEISDSPVPLLFISFPSAKDPLWDEKHPGKSTATIVTFANFKWFEKWEGERVHARGDEYEKRKKDFGQLIWNQTVALFPQLKDKVEYFEVGTPITNNYYLRANKGEMYGADHDLGRFTAEAAVQLRPKTDIPGLYLTGQDIFNCGIAGASFGGLLCANEVLGRNVYADLVALKGRSRPSIGKEGQK
jgi:all-trans-retinol 13,14-reductase